MFNIFLASPRGYCAGVNRAIKMLDEVIKEYGSPIYVNHEIIHNKFIVDYFIKKGVIFTDDLNIVPAGSIMVFSAHGVGPNFVKQVKQKGIRYIDASCPLVTKVHNEAVDFIEKGYEIIYIGRKHHQEAIGVKDNDLDKIHIVGNRDEADELSFGSQKKLALLNQTTLSVDDTKDLIDYVKSIYPDIVLPGFSDICYATTNRQNAVKALVERVDKLIIVGSSNSSNSVKLRDIGTKNFVSSILIDDKGELDEKFLIGAKNIGISSGASVPDKLVWGVIKKLEKFGGKFLEEIVVEEEKVIFPYKLTLK